MLRGERLGGILEEKSKRQEWSDWQGGEEGPEDGRLKGTRDIDAGFEARRGMKRHGVGFALGMKSVDNAVEAIPWSPGWNTPRLWPSLDMSRLKPLRCSSNGSNPTCVASTGSGDIISSNSRPQSSSKTTCRGLATWVLDASALGIATPS